MKPRLLYLDDETQSLKYLARYLSDVCDVSSFDDPLAAFAYLEEQAHPVDIVLADHRMPNMQGAEFLEKISSRWPEPARILTTAYADIDCLCQFINQGSVDQIVLKPWDMSTLSTTITSIIHNISIPRRETIGDDHGTIASIIDNAQRSLTAADLLAAASGTFASRTINQILPKPNELKKLNFHLRQEISNMRSQIQLLSHYADFGQEISQRTTLSMRECLERIFTSDVGLLDPKEIISFDLSSDFLFFGEAKAMKSIVMVIFANSLHALMNRPNPWLSITLMPSHEANSVIFEDNGNWLTSQFVKQLFEPTDPDSLEHETRLSIAEKFARSMGGSLCFEPSSTGGMKTTIKLPRLAS